MANSSSDAEKLNIDSIISRLLEGGVFNAVIR